MTKKSNTNKIIYLAPIIILSVFSLFFAFNYVYKTKPQILLLDKSLAKAKTELNKLKNENQYKINQKLKKDLESTHDAYTNSIKAYEKILDLKAQKQDTKEMEEKYAKIVKDLSDLNFSSGSDFLKELNNDIEKQYNKIAAAAQAAIQTANTVSQSQLATINNTPPSSGYSYQAVKSDNGTFNVAMIAADLTSTRVIVDTASDSNCSNNCPALPLSDYVSRNGAFAGINGSFFCPPEYPSCAGKTNSFDTLLMNKNKIYFNSDNNVYSAVPLAYFTGNTMGVRGQSLEWGRDTGIDAVIANHPLYLAGGNNMFGGSSDPKINNKGARTFIANKGSFVYIGIIYNASSADAASILKALGMENALGLDQGGSTALWFGGYKAGPGRNIPNAILFVRK